MTRPPKPPKICQVPELWWYWDTLAVYYPNGMIEVFDVLGRKVRRKWFHLDRDFLFCYSKVEFICELK